MQASISENTCKVYKQGLQSFYNFRVKCAFQQTWPPPLPIYSVMLPYTSERVVLFNLLKQFLIMSSQMNKEVYFAHLNSKPMTQYQFSSMLYKALKFQDIQTSNYKTHSYRIREATHLYLGGLSEGGNPTSISRTVL